MVTFHDFVVAFRKLEIDSNNPVIAHTSLSAFGWVQGGADTLIGALLSSFHTLVMPTFAYKTMVTPEIGPADNAVIYGSRPDQNRAAEFFRSDMPADPLMGAVPEALRRYPKARRSRHPLLSFAGVNADRALQAQSMNEPLAPIRMLMESGGWVLLLGVDHTVNTSIHLAERLAGRKQFIRWALTPHGVKECPGFPGCSDGFQALAPRLEAFCRRVQVGAGLIQAVPLMELVEIARDWIVADPLALLCDRPYCERCLAVRAEMARV